jgi:hypothetical protein
MTWCSVMLDTLADDEAPWRTGSELSAVLVQQPGHGAGVVDGDVGGDTIGQNTRMPPFSVPSVHMPSSFPGSRAQVGRANLAR